MTIENDSNSLFKRRVDKSKKNIANDKPKRVDEDTKMTSNL